MATVGSVVFRDRWSDGALVCSEYVAALGMRTPEDLHVSPSRRKPGLRTFPASNAGVGFRLFARSYMRRG
jgi:hypothetical protein